MSKDKDQRSEIRGQDMKATERLLRSALPLFEDNAELDRDLWPAMLHRMENPRVQRVSVVPWFDWALAGGLLAFAAFAPRTIPVILYYL